MLIFTCYTNTTGNSVNGWTISLFYSGAARFFPILQCALNDGELQLCMLTEDCGVIDMSLKLLKCLGTNPPPTLYGPLFYGNHTVTVQATSAITFQVTTIKHQGTPIE